MQLSEAKDMYFQYTGNDFFMGREEPQKYREYRSLNISEIIKRQWDEELVHNLLESLWDQPDRIWILHQRIIEILMREPPNMEYLGSKLLDEMEHMPKLDVLNKTLVIENMAGRNEKLNDGGVYFFCKYTKLGKRMNEITEKIMDFSCDQEANMSNSRITPDRLNRAKARYRESYQKWRHNG